MAEPLPTENHPVSPDGPRRPALLVFDVNETLSDMAPMAGRFEDVGAPGHLARTWFAALLRDGFALTVSGKNPAFAELGSEGLRLILDGIPLNRSLEESVEHIMAGFTALEVHSDVPAGVEALSDLGIRLVTLTNGSTSVAERLLSEAGIRDRFERLLSVEQAGIWKPSADAYAYALAQCQVDPTNAMLVAVHPWDTDGAQRAGLDSAWINRSGSGFPAYYRSPTLQATSLVDLADHLR